MRQLLLPLIVLASCVTEAPPPAAPAGSSSSSSGSETGSAPEAPKPDVGEAKPEQLELPLAP